MSALADLPEWQLDDLYGGLEDPRMTADLETLKGLIADFAARYEGRVVAVLPEGDPQGGGTALAEALRAYEVIEDLTGRLGSYAMLVFAGDTTDPARSKLYADTQTRLTTLSSDILFFELELMDIPDAVLEAAVATDPLRAYAPWLRQLRAGRKHRLSRDLERLSFEKAQTARSAWVRLYDQTTSALRVPLGGEDLTLTQAMDRLTVAARAERENAATAIAQTCTEHHSTFALIYNTLVRDRQTEDKWRGFAEPPHFRHLANDVDPDVVEALASAVREAAPRLAHRYYAWKAKALGLETLAYWDRSAPLPGDDGALIGWDEARRTVLDAFSGFTPAMAGHAEHFFERGWIDAAPRPGKMGGAFSHPTVPSAHPYVMLNYQGKPRDVMTLAHELGHGVHQTLAAPLGPLLSQTPLTLAETASVFGEMLTFRSLLDRESDPARRRLLLASKVEDKINTVVRQIAFYEFEKAVHAQGRHGELTPEDFNRLWRETQEAALGPSLDVSGYEPYWCLVPHFINAPFYVYAYAFGDGLVNALYDVYEQGDSDFVPRYVALLSAGGTRRYDEALAPFGLDPRDPAFWKRGLDLIERMLTQLENADG